MKRRTLLAVLFTLMVGFGWACARQTLANRTSEPNAGSPVIQTRVADSGYTLSGPHSHKNLTIFLIHGKNQTADKSPLTLQEALEQKKTGHLSFLGFFVSSRLCVRFQFAQASSNQCQSFSRR